MRDQALGTLVHVDKSALLDEAVIRRCLELLDQRGVLVFPKIRLNDAEQLAFTDKLGARVNFTARVPGGNSSAQDVYTITLDPKINTEPEYVLGTYFWHMDGLTSPIIPPKASVLSARTVAPKGGQTELASSYAAYEALPEEDKKDLEVLRVIHSVTAAVRLNRRLPIAITGRSATWSFGTTPAPCIGSFPTPPTRDAECIARRWRASKRWLDPALLKLTIKNHQ